MKPRAFTLVELVIVLAIFAITAAIAVPRYQHAASRYRALTAARRLAADIDNLRQTAITKSLTHLLRAPAAGTRYQTVDKSSGWAGGSVTTINLGIEPYLAAFTTVDLGADGELVFDGFGNPDGPATFTLTSGNAAARVTVTDKSGITTVTLIKKS